MRRYLHITRLILIVVLQLSLINLVLAADVNLEKISPRFQLLLKEGSTSGLQKKAVSRQIKVYTDDRGVERVGVLIKTKSPAALEAARIHYNSVVEEMVTAKVTIEELKQISLLSDVDYIERPIISHPATNVSLAENGTLLLQNGAYNDIPYKGKDAIVLIFDTGIDWNHLDFKNPQDTTKTRILYIWDQTLGALPGESHPAGFNYGVEYSKSDIDDEIDGSPKGYVREVDSNGHGTHVAGTAAGSGSKFTGVAPEADLIIVKGGDESFPEDNIIDALTYADQKATQFGKPVVVNLSLGGHDGPHDGSRAYEQSIDNFCSKSGRVVVISAGNSGSDQIHRSGTLSASGSTSLQITVPAYTATSGSSNDNFVVSIWYNGSQTVRAKVTSPNGFIYERTANTSGESANQSDGRIYLENRFLGGNLTTIGLEVYDASSTSPPAQGTWKLELLDASGPITWDGWLATNFIGEPLQEVLLSSGNDEKSVSMPGTANEGITVGAYMTKTVWPAIDGGEYWYGPLTVGDIASFSSYGPTRDGRQKPEIAAPGMGIVAALSEAARNGISLLRINPDNRHFLIEGTSMAAPHVTGAVALLLANQPNLTADQVKELLMSTAVKDSYTGGVPNYGWGYGKMNILQAVVRQMTTDSMVTRTITSYDNLLNGPYYVFTGAEKFAVRYQAVNTGIVSGAFLKTVNNDSTLNPIINGDGNLLCAIHQDNNGFPGTQIGSTVVHPLAGLDPGTDNYINLLPAGVQLNASQYYHIVLSLSNPANSIKIKFDSGENNQVQNYSEIYLSGQWRKMGDAFSSPYNLLLKSETIRYDILNAIEGPTEKIASRFELYQNYPNPFNPSTNIRFMLTRQGTVNLTVFDVLGREVITLVDEVEKAGMHEISWNGKNRRQNQVPTGIYFYRLKSDEGVITRKMLLVK